MLWKRLAQYSLVVEAQGECVMAMKPDKEMLTYLNIPIDLWTEANANALEIGVTLEKYVIEGLRYAMLAEKSGTMFPRPKKKASDMPSPRSRPGAKRRGTR
jgi:hypothetical protein